MAKKTTTQPTSHPPVMAIIGNEPYLRHEVLARILEPMQEEMGALGPVRFEGDRTSAAEVLDEVRTPSLLGGRRVVILEEAGEFISVNRELMEKYCQSPVQDAVFILLCDSLPKNQKVYRYIDALGGIVACDVPKGAAFANWITQRSLTAHGKKIGAAAVQCLRRLLGDSPGWIDAELAKLSAYVGDRAEIGLSDVNELTDQRREQLVFGIIDAILAGKSAEALALWDQVLATDRAAPGRALGGLAYKVRQMIEAIDLLEETGSVHSISGRMFMDPHDLRRLLEGVTREQLLEQQRDLLRADLAVKTGLSALPLVIERFIVKHAAQPATRARAG